MGDSIVFTDLSWNDLWFMAEGAGRTLNLAVWSCLFGTLLGIGTGTARASWPVVVSAIFGIYVDVLRSVPLLIQFILINAGLAVLGHPQSPVVVGILVLSLTQTASGRTVGSRQWRPSPEGAAFGAMIFVGGLLWKCER